MKTVKKTAEYTIYERNDGRYAVKNAAKKWVNGEDKVAILSKEKLLKKPQPKPKAEEPEAEQQAAEQAATEAEAEKSAEEGEATGE